VGISILSQIEFLAFPNLTENDRRTFQEFSDAVEVVGLGRTERALIDRIVSLRAQHRLKLPDAIIAATAVERDATLITDDHQLQKLSAIRSSGTSAPE
jgi:predicted nucleic acid-binding protein